MILIKSISYHFFSLAFSCLLFPLFCTYIELQRVWLWCTSIILKRAKGSCFMSDFILFYLIRFNAGPRPLHSKKHQHTDIFLSDISQMMSFERKNVYLMFFCCVVFLVRHLSASIRSSRNTSFELEDIHIHPISYLHHCCTDRSKIRSNYWIILNIPKKNFEKLFWSQKEMKILIHFKISN